MFCSRTLQFVVGLFMTNTTLCGKTLHLVVKQSFLWYNITFLCYFVVLLWYICITLWHICVIFGVYLLFFYMFYLAQPGVGTGEIVVPTNKYLLTLLSLLSVVSK